MLNYAFVLLDKTTLQTFPFSSVLCIVAWISLIHLFLIIFFAATKNRTLGAQITSAFAL